MEGENEPGLMLTREQAEEHMENAVDDSSIALAAVNEGPVLVGEGNSAKNDSLMNVQKESHVQDRNENAPGAPTKDTEEDQKQESGDMPGKTVIENDIETNVSVVSADGCTIDCDSKMTTLDASCETKEGESPDQSKDAAGDEDAPVLMEYRKAGGMLAVEDSDTSPDSSSEDEAEAMAAVETLDPSTQINQTISNERDQSPDRDRRVKLNRYGFEDVRTKGELLPEELPPLEELTITVDESVIMKEVGHIKSIVGVLVVIQSNENTSPLDDDSILFVNGHKVLGQVFEVFGPVKKPWYSVRFNDIDNISHKGLQVGMTVYCAPKEEAFTRYVFLENMKNIRGSDASWEDNNEPPEKHLEYSDDEAERVAKSRKKKGGPKQGERVEAGDQGNKRKRNRDAMNKDKGGNPQSNGSQHGNQRRNPFQGNTSHSPNPRFSNQSQSNHGNNGSQRWPPGPNAAHFNRPPQNFGGPPRFQPNNQFTGYQQNFGNFVPQLNTSPHIGFNNSQNFSNSFGGTGSHNSSGLSNNSPGTQMNPVRPVFGQIGAQGSNVPPDFTRPPPPFVGSNQSFNQHQANMGHMQQQQPSTMSVNQPQGGLGIQTGNSNTGQYGNMGMLPTCNLNNSPATLPNPSGQFMQPPGSRFQSPQVMATNAGQQNQSGPHGFLPSVPHMPGTGGNPVGGVVNSNSQRGQFWNLNQQDTGSVQNNMRNIGSPMNPVSSSPNFHISPSHFNDSTIQTSMNSRNANIYGHSTNSNFTYTDGNVNSSRDWNSQQPNVGFQGLYQGPGQGPNHGGFQSPVNIKMQGTGPFQYMGKYRSVTGARL
ncbi:uncharacterized protein LOC127866095 isoform X2 [Dreissena polymorpha]|nr:uncharacterized protein LOC127866095 isoform X2 [Dreissena polymorpha]XP_052262451.1 uncharacterized protein LOC127866095 isoform X2 [Dreissena polymorpha]